MFISKSSLEVKEKGITYLVRTFLEKYIQLLDFRVIDFDHLTEKEQRERQNCSGKKNYRKCVQRKKTESYNNFIFCAFMFFCLWEKY